MKTQPQHNWNAFLKLFSQQNQGRKTRLAVFEGTPELMSDYWIEEGLPFVGIDMDPDGKEGPEVEVVLQSSSQGTPKNMVRNVTGARFIKIILSATGDADGLEIDNGKGETTVMHFEK